MKEKLISFLPDRFPEPETFFVELTGVTYPDPRYHIDRNRSRFSASSTSSRAGATWRWEDARFPRRPGTCT